MTRKDFFTTGDWLRYLHEGGLAPEDEGQPNRIVNSSTDPAVLLHQAIYGPKPPRPPRSPDYVPGVTRYLSSKKFERAYIAAAFANCQGFVLNAFISVTWSSVGITTPDDVRRAQMRYLELLRKALRKRQIPVAWVWVLENGRTRGLHSHILASVPFSARNWLRKQAAEAIATIAGRPVVTKPSERTVVIGHRQDADVRAQWILLKYM